MKTYLERIASDPKMPKPMMYRNGTVSSNGRIFLWVPMVWVDYPEPDVKLRAKLDGYFGAQPPTLAAAMPVGPLREWAGPVVWREPCPACKGTSKDSPHVHCSFCENDGEMLPEARRGYLYGAPINRNYLAMLLERWTETVTLRWSGDHEKPLYLVGETWLACLMPMMPIMDRLDESEGPNPWPDAPRLPAP